MDQIIEQVKELAFQFQAGRLCLFGSRARGDHRKNSDYDFAVWGVPAQNRPRMQNAVEELPFLAKIDLVFVTEGTAPALLANIQKDGITLMDKFEAKYQNYKRALVRLRYGIERYHAEPEDLMMQDAVIQRFEFTCELAWKTAREYLIRQGHTELNSPKPVMRQALEAGLIFDGEGWMALLTDRNLTSHLYDEETANQIMQRICGTYIGLLDSLYEKMGE